MRCLLGVIALCLALARPAAAVDPPPLWGGLEPGPHGVGFDSYWLADPARTYMRPGVDPSPSPRPVLVNVWYPAPPDAGPPMPHGGYLEIARDAPAGSLAADLAAYARGVIAAEVFGPAGEDAEAMRAARLESFLGTPTAAVRDAPRVPGPLPLVLYHAGYGSSYEDNAVLCEYLASHGYLVLGSAFLSGDGSSFNIDAESDSARDLEQLIREACARWGADWGRIAMIGHSGGAHTGFRFIAQANDPVRAFVSLDTTQDYHSFADRRWDDFVPLVLDRAAEIEIPMLFAARQHAMFRLAGRLDRSPRLCLTFRDLEHNSFIAQGVIAAELGAAPEAAQIRAAYDELCRAVLLFLDAEIRGSAEARAQLAARWSGATPGRPPVIAERLPIGAGAPPAYDPGASDPPTPRQVAAALDAGDTSILTGALAAFADDPRAEPLREEEFAISVLFQLVHEAREPEARRVLAAYGAAQPEILRLIGAMRDLYERVGAEDLAERFGTVFRALGGAADEQPP